MRYSFSRLSCYEGCPFNYYQRYVIEEQGDGNYWADVGTIMHDILRRIAIGELSPDDAPSEFADRYETEVLYETKQSTMDKVYADCMNFLAEYQYEYLDEYKVVGTEIEVNYKVDGIELLGYIDILLQDKVSGEYIVMDYKSCKPFFGKKGKLLKAMQSTFDEYKKQMALYCIAVEQLFGSLPSKVMWLHFRDQAITRYELSKEDISEAVSWVSNLHKTISSDEQFLPIKDWFKCQNLCDYRNSCQYLLLDDTEEEEE